MFVRMAYVFIKIVLKSHFYLILILIYLNFRPLEVVSRYGDPQPQVVENYSYLISLRPNIYKSLCFIPKQQCIAQLANINKTD